MTSIYNKYIDRNCVYTKVNRNDNNNQNERRKEKSLLKNLDINSMLDGILPDWLDSGDAVLLLLLLFLYIESDDSDFLIILAVIAYTIFKDD